MNIRTEKKKMKAMITQDVVKKILISVSRYVYIYVLLLVTKLVSHIKYASRFIVSIDWTC